MIRNLKVLGLAITAVLAMSAVWAVSAQAASPELHCTSTTNTCDVTGTEINRHTFNVQGGNVRCESRLTVTLGAKTVSSVSGVTAEYRNCRAFGVAANVNMNGCTYTLTNVASSNPATANVSISCPGSATIDVDAPSLPCTINVGTQGPLGHIVFNNKGNEPTHVDANITVSGITYTMSGVGCPGGGPGTYNDGTYNGESTLEAFNDDRPHENANKVGLHVRLT